MNALRRALDAACRRARPRRATGRASRNVAGDDPDGGPAVGEQAVERQQRAEHGEDPELDDLDDLLGAARRSTRAGPAGGRRSRSPRRTRAMKPLPCGGSTVSAVGGEREAEPVERALVAPGSRRRGARARSRGISSEPTSPQARPKARPRPTSCSTKCHQTKSLLPGFQRRGEREHGRQREAVVEPRLEVQRVADDARHARVGDDAGGEHRVGRARAARPSRNDSVQLEADEPVREQRDDGRGDRHRRPPACAAGSCQWRCSSSRVDLEAVAEQDHDQRDGREVA